MKQSSFSRSFFLFFLIAIVFSINVKSQDNSSSDGGWPKVMLSGSDTVVMYQPQVDSWTDNLLAFRTAICYINSTDGKQVFGVLVFSARTEVDKPNNLVYIEDLKTTSMNFPSMQDNGKKVSYVVTDYINNNDNKVSLTRLQSDLAINNAMNTKKTEVKNSPPKIYIHTSPALLIIIDGTAKPKEITSTSYSRIINTSALLLISNQVYYMSLFGQWYQSSDITGPWVAGTNIPNDINTIKYQVLAKDSTIQLFDPPGDDIKNFLAQGKQPKIIVSETPAELITIAGKPDYESIEGTNLLYIKNTKADVFKNISDNLSYVLISGRWYSSPALNGPWNFVDSSALPNDFAKIPNDGPKANVLVSVPGTIQAKEAAISTQIPQTATVKRGKADVQPKYDGDPQYQNIQGTQMNYVVNSPNPVIHINGEYYMVQNGIWYYADSPYGPWFVAFDIPIDIYTIPPACPIYYATYVRVYSYDDDFVYCGYTPGYFGCYVNPWGTVVYGTGWSYNPWVGACWFGPPCTFGCGVGFSWSWNVGFGCSFGWGMPHPPFFHPWFGPAPFGPRVFMGGGMVFNHYNVYNNVNRNVVVNNFNINNRANIDNRFNQQNIRPANGNFNRPNNLYAGNDNKVYSPSQNLKQSGSLNNAGVDQFRHNEASPTQAQAGSQFRNADFSKQPATDQFRNNNFNNNAGVDQFRHDNTSNNFQPQNNWRVNEGGNNWNNVNRSAAPQQNFQHLDNSASSRSMGSMRTESFQPSMGAAHMSGGGGGFRR